jgi:hypothetical protein
MTRIPMKLLALAAFAAATPAAAQWGGANVDTERLRIEIDAGVSRGDISSQEAYSLRSQLRGLMNLERQYARDGLTVNERYDLQQRAQGLRNEIAEAQGYASGYGRYDNRGSRYGTNGNGYGTPYNEGTYGNRGYGTYDNGTYNNGAYGNRGYGAYNEGTYNNGAYGSRGYGNNQYAQSNQYSQYRQTDRDDDDSYDRDDRDDDGYALRVGERVSGGLYAVPDAYRYRFRDSGSVYYRYGNGNVYQVDARTGVVMRIYPIGR